MMKCNCIPNSEQFEFEIPEENQISISFNIQDNSNIDKLKRKIICEYLEIINKLKCGIQPNLEFLLEEISLIWTKIYSTT